MKYGHHDSGTHFHTINKLQYIGLSFSVFVLTFLMSAVIAHALRCYRRLLRKDKILWNLCIARGVFGIFCINVGVWSFFIDTDLRRDIIFESTLTSHRVISIAVGFFLFDWLMLTWSGLYYRQFNWLLNFHHLLSLVGYSLILNYDCIHYFGCRGLIVEMTTPFSCLCWTLLKSGMADTVLWKMNQFLLVHLYHTRSVIECSIWYETFCHWGDIWQRTPGPVLVAMYTLLVLVTFLMTPYWKYIKTVQLTNPVDWSFEDGTEHMDSHSHLNGRANGHVSNHVNGHEKKVR